MNKPCFCECRPIVITSFVYHTVIASVFYYHIQLLQIVFYDCTVNADCVL